MARNFWVFMMVSSLVAGAFFLFCVASGSCVRPSGENSMHLSSRNHSRERRFDLLGVTPPDARHGIFAAWPHAAARGNAEQEKRPRVEHRKLAAAIHEFTLPLSRPRARLSQKQCRAFVAQAFVCARVHRILVLIS